MTSPSPSSKHVVCYSSGVSQRGSSASLSFRGGKPWQQPFWPGHFLTNELLALRVRKFVSCLSQTNSHPALFSCGGAGESNVKCLSEQHIHFCSVTMLCTRLCGPGPRQTIGKTVEPKLCLAGAGEPTYMVGFLTASVSLEPTSVPSNSPAST